MTMSQTVAVWFVVLAALAAANLPFINQRFLLVVRLAQTKPLSLRLLELVLFYFLVGGVALLLEKRAGQIAPQNWEFYAITATLFLTLAFPGFVYRYLFKRHG
jgi:hypothetical protein